MPGPWSAISSYSGADKMSASPLIILDYAMANDLFIRTSRGIGYGSQAGPFSYSAALGYRGNREDHKPKGGFYEAQATGIYYLPLPSASNQRLA